MMLRVGCGPAWWSTTPRKKTCETFRGWLQRYGRPLAHYTDKNSIFRHRSGAAALQEQLRGEAALSQFGRALRELGIEWIAAHSPQAKDYASHCTSWVRCDTTLFARRRWDSFTPWAFRGGLSPGCSYR